MHQYRLDLLRFGAALLVLIGHFAFFGISAPEPTATGADRAFAELGGVGWFGWIGVQIFFVISGYVIAASAIATSWQTFAIKRAIRVFPALWVCSLVALAVRVAWGEPLALTVPDFVRSIFLSPKGPYIDGVVWTLVLEAVFYGLVAAVISRSSEGRNRSRSLDRLAIWLGAVSAAFLIVVVVVEATQITVYGQSLAALLDRFPFKVALLWHGVFFSLGMLILSIHKAGSTRFKIVCATFLLAMGVVQIQLQAERGDPMIPIAVWLLAVATIAWARLDAQWKPGPKTARVTQSLGLMTYPLYLGHFTLGMYLIPMLSPVITDRNLLFAVLIAIIFTNAWVIVIGPERLLQRWGRRTLLEGFRAGIDRRAT